MEFDIYFLEHAFPLFLCFKHVSFDNGRCLYFNAIEYIKVVTVQKMQTLLQVLPLPSSKDSYLQNEASFINQSVYVTKSGTSRTWIRIEADERMSQRSGSKYFIAPVQMFLYKISPLQNCTAHSNSPSHCHPTNLHITSNMTICIKVI